MNRTTILLHFSIMFFTVASYAQKKQGGAMQWEIASCIPVANGQSKALGVAGPVAGMHNERLIVAGGANFPDGMPWEGGKKKYYDEVFIYSKAGDKLILNQQRFKLPFAIAYAASCSSPQGVVYAGGENETGTSKKVFLMQWNANDSNLAIKKLPDLPVALTNASAAVHNNIVFIAGGETAQLTSDKIYCLDINNPGKGWQQLPDIPVQVSHAVAVEQSGNEHAYIYLLGGRRKNVNALSDFYGSVLRYDIDNAKWEERASLPHKISAATGIAVSPGYLLLFGGDRGDTFNEVERLILAINKENNEKRKQTLISRKNKLQSAHPGFSRDILLYDSGNDHWTVIGEMTFDSPVTTTAVKWDDHAILPSGEIKAGVRTPRILSATFNLPGQ